jgi:DNA-binding transcriptional MocR family regulator
MTRTKSETGDPLPRWAAALGKSDGPLYLAIAEAIAAAIASGELANNARLPAQRALAQQLGIDYTTVNRGYAEAQRRGLLVGLVGQGSFVRRPPPALPPLLASSDLIDLGLIAPPPFDDPELSARMWRAIAALEETGGLDLLQRYRPPGGTPADRAVALRWLSRRIAGLTQERVLVAPSVHGALLAALNTVVAPGDLMVAEALTYSAFRSLAFGLRLRVRPLPMDREGLDPDAFEAACRDECPKALYCMPTQHAATVATMSQERRAAVAAVARRYGVMIIEDDSYGTMPAAPPSPLVNFAPELTFCLSGISKTISAALRIAYVAVPDTRAATRMTNVIRSTAGMASPLTAAIASRWIEDGIADAVLAAVREETRIRQALVARILPPALLATEPEAHHAWLTFPPPWTRGEFASRLQSEGVAMMSSDAFALENPPEAGRLSLGGPPTRVALESGLNTIAGLLEESPMLLRAAV